MRRDPLCLAECGVGLLVIAGNGHSAVSVGEGGSTKVVRVSGDQVQCCMTERV